MKLRFGSLALGAVLSSAPFVFAQTSLVAWGPSASYVTATQSGQRAAAGGVISFSMATPISPLATSYTGGVFYGGASSAGSMNTGFAVFNNNVNGGGNDTLLFGRSTGVVAGQVVTGVFLWKQSDFLAFSSVSDNVTATSFSFTGLVTSGSSTGNEARFVIQQGSTYMISANVGLNAGLSAHSLSNPSSVSWFSYDPVAGLSSISGSAIVSPTFNNVTAAGLYLTTTSTGTSAINLAFTNFSVSGTVAAVPEPSTAAALAGLGSMALVGLRRRKR